MREKVSEFFKSKFFRVFLSFLLLLYLFSKVNFSLFFLHLKQAQEAYLLLALALLPFSIALRSYNWGLILNREKPVLSLRDLNRLNLLGIGASLFLPAGSGEVVKAYYGGKVHGHREDFFTSVFLDKMTSLIALFLLGSFFGFLKKLTAYAIPSLLLGLALFFFLFLPRAFFFLSHRYLETVFKEKVSLRRLGELSVLPSSLLLKVLIISFFGWLVTYFQFFLVCRTFNLQVSFPYLLAVSPLIGLARLFPFTLNGLGSGEAAIVYLFQQVGVASELSLLASLASQIINAFLPGFLGLYFFYRQELTLN